MNSYMNTSDKTLARLSPQRAKAFLMELANLGESQAAAERFRRRFSAVMPVEMEAPEDVRDKEDIKRAFREYHEYVSGEWHISLTGLRDDVRRAWREPDLRTKEYVLFLLQQQALPGLSIIALLPSTLPPATLFEQAIVYFRRAIDRAQICKNPDCPAPYFFSSRRNQRYCSDACAVPAQREFKRQWWAEHGEEWRAKKKQQPSRKGKK